MKCNAPFGCDDCHDTDCPGSDGDGWMGLQCQTCHEDRIEANCAECHCFKCPNPDSVCFDCDNRKDV